MRERRSAVLIELDAAPAGRSRSTVALALVVGISAGLAIYESAQPDAPRALPSAPMTSALAPSWVPAPRTLALAADVADVELIAFPDWLANEPLPTSFRTPVAVRGTTGIVSVEGLTVINWTEHGVSYRLESVKRGVNELVQIANALR